MQIGGGGYGVPRGWESKVLLEVVDEVAKKQELKRKRLFSPSLGRRQGMGALGPYRELNTEG